MAGTQKNPEQDIKQEGKTQRRKPAAGKPLAEPLADTKKGLTVKDDGCTPVEDAKRDENSVWKAMSKEELIDFITEALPNLQALSKEAESAVATIRTALGQIGSVTKTSEEAQKAQAALDRLNLQFKELKESLGIDQNDDGEIIDVQKAFETFVKRYADSINLELVNQKDLLANQLEQAEVAHATALEQKDREIQAVSALAAAAESKAAALEERNKQLEGLAKVGAAFVNALNGAKLEPKQFVAQMLETKTKVDEQEEELAEVLKDDEGKKISLSQFIKTIKEQINGLDQVFVAVANIVYKICGYFRNLLSVLSSQDIITKNLNDDISGKLEGIQSEIKAELGDEIQDE